MTRAREYGWYLTGCDRMGEPPVTEEEFSAWWQEYENHAEMLKAANRDGTLASVDPALRAQMEKRADEDRLVMCLLVGMGELGDIDA